MSRAKRKTALKTHTRMKQVNQIIKFTAINSLNRLAKEKLKLLLWQKEIRRWQPICIMAPF